MNTLQRTLQQSTLVRKEGTTGLLKLSPHSKHEFSRKSSKKSLFLYFYEWIHFLKKTNKTRRERKGYSLVTFIKEKMTVVLKTG